MENKTSTNHEKGNDANRLLAAVLIQENETVVRVNRECDLCGGKVDKYDKFTEEEHCQNCGWS
jgi:tRNA U54 and U55 pseudouridine synthase Pus10